MDGHFSSVRMLPGGGPQGWRMGELSYLSQTNNNADCVPPSDRYKWVDDLSILEIINIVSAGTSSYDFQKHVASDIAIDQKYLPTQNLQS